MVDLDVTANFDTVRDPFRSNVRQIIEKDIVLGALFNVNRTGPATIFPTDLAPLQVPATVRFWCTINLDTLDLILQRKKGGVTAESILTTLTANRPFIQEIPFSTSGETFNFRTSATSAVTYNVRYISVVEKVIYRSAV